MRNFRDISNTVSGGALTIVNHVSGSYLDCNDADVSGAILRDFVGTLVSQLSEMRIINATVTN